MFKNRFQYLKIGVFNHDLRCLIQLILQKPLVDHFLSSSGVVFSVILSIVLIGLAFLLMWKFFTSMRDRREFAKFEKERMMAKWDSVSFKIGYIYFFKLTDVLVSFLMGFHIRICCQTPKIFFLILRPWSQVYKYSINSSNFCNQKKKNKKIPFFCRYIPFPF